MKKLVKIVVVLITAFSMTFCSSDKKEEIEIEFEAYKQEKLNDSLLMASLTKELSDINDVLDQADSLSNYFQSAEQFSKESALEKVLSINDVLEQSNKKIEELENKINATPDPNNIVYQNAINTSKGKVSDYASKFSSMENKINDLTTENIEMKDLLAEKDAEISNNKVVISDLGSKVARQKEELKRIEREIAATERKLVEAKKETKEQRGKIYYDSGMEYLKAFVNVPKIGTIFGGKKTKKSLIRRAYNCFVISHNSGNEFAINKINLIKNKEEYNKYLPK